MTITPKTIAVELRISRRLLKNSAADFEAAIRYEIIKAFMQEIDRVAIIGSTASNQPDGLLNIAGIPLLAAGTNGALPTWQNLVDMEFNVSSRNAILDKGAFLINPALGRKLRTTQRSTGLDFILSDSRNILGYDTRISSLLPSNLTKGSSGAVCSPAVFGDFSEMIIAFWGPAAIDLIVDGVTMVKDGLIRLIARADVGVAIRNVGAFTVCKDFLTA